MAGVLKENRGPEASEVADILLERCWMLMEDRSYRRAEMVCREALALLREAAGEDHPRVGIGLAHLLAVYVRQERHREAGEAVASMLKILKTCEGSPDRDQLAWWLSKYVEYLRSWQCFQQADMVESWVIGVRHVDR